MTKQEFLLQATLNGFVGLGHQTDRIGGEYIVSAADSAWKQLEMIRERDEQSARDKRVAATRAEDRV